MKYSQPLLPDFFRFLATDEAFFPSAVRTDLGKCAIVRFLLAADAAFFMFFLAAILCLVELICLHPFLSSSRTEMTAVYRKDIFSRIYAAHRLSPEPGLTRTNWCNNTSGHYL